MGELQYFGQFGIHCYVNMLQLFSKLEKLGIFDFPSFFNRRELFKTYNSLGW